MDSKSDSKQISIVGLGLLGSAVARRYLAHKWTVTGYDLEQQRCDEHISAGGRVADSLAECVKANHYCIFCLPTGDIARGVLRQIVSLDLPGDSLIVFDMTTGAPETMQQNAALAARQHIAYLDTCVGGSSREAEQGSAILMVGGDPDVLRGAQDVLHELSESIFHVGKAGDGARMKLVTNLVLGLERLVLAEGFSLARSLGLDLNQTLEILKSGPAHSHVMTTKGEKMIQHDWSPQAKLDQHWKDVQLMLAESRDCKIDLPLTQLHHQVLEKCSRAGWGQFDNCAVYQAYCTDNFFKSR